MITDYSTRPYLQQAATPGTVISDSPLFPQRMWTAGTATISLITTDVNGGDRQTLTWSFEVLAAPAPLTNVRFAQLDAETARIFWDEGSSQSDLPVLSYVANYYLRELESNSWGLKTVETNNRFIDLPRELGDASSVSWPTISAANAAGSAEWTEVPTWDGYTEDYQRVTRGLRMVSTGLPSGAELALTNLTMTEIEDWWLRGSGYITAKPCGSLYDEEQSTSSGNFVESIDDANLAVVPLG
jgi:hypothetical protein